MEGINAFVKYSQIYLNVLHVKHKSLYYRQNKSFSLQGTK